MKDSDFSSLLEFLSSLSIFMFFQVSIKSAIFFGLSFSLSLLILLLFAPLKNQQKSQNEIFNSPKYVLSLGYTSRY
jgi:hypothetical protein